MYKFHNARTKYDITTDTLGRLRRIYGTPTVLNCTANTIRAYARRFVYALSVAV